MKPPPSDGTVRVGCERRRAGTMTTIFGLRPLDLDVVAKELKRRCGTGGTAKDGVVELQGDRCAFWAPSERGLPPPQRENLKGTLLRTRVGTLSKLERAGSNTQSFGAAASDTEDKVWMNGARARHR